VISCLFSIYIADRDIYIYIDIYDPSETIKSVSRATCAISGKPSTGCGANNGGLPSAEEREREGECLSSFFYCYFNGNVNPEICRDDPYDPKMILIIKKSNNGRKVSSISSIQVL